VLYLELRVIALPDVSATRDSRAAAPAGRLSPLQLVTGVLGALAATVAIVAFAISVWPKHEPLAQRVKPSLTQLELANDHLTASLNGLRPGSGARLARARSERAASVTSHAIGAIDRMDVSEAERELERALRSALTAETVYLDTVHALLWRKASVTQQRHFWQASEDLRNRLDDVNRSVSAISAASVGGANVLAQWFRNRTGRQTAIAKFPPAQRSAARRQMGPGPTVDHKQCSDDIDNDADGKTDLDDPDCTNASDDSEAADHPTTQCSDHVDNDADGKTDLDDPGCTGTDDTSEADVTPPAECSDSVDNDGDGVVDGADPGCASGDKESLADPPAKTDPPSS
jgi:hypothetical protein